ncbi:hypothetical protein PAXINDRAFT_153975 [Paxillus involutus ATCC 200175]|nr:hypothetical protein PAXINDRAFT_153975 [Paxillus involutus ATCC 200175]
MSGTYKHQPLSAVPPHLLSSKKFHSRAMAISPEVQLDVDITMASVSSVSARASTPMSHRDLLQLEATCREQQGEITGLSGRLDVMEAKFDAKFDTLEAKVDTLEAKVDTLEAKFDALDAKVTARFEALDAQFAKLMDIVTASPTNVPLIGRGVREPAPATDFATDFDEHLAALAVERSVRVYPLVRPGILPDAQIWTITSSDGRLQQTRNHDACDVKVPAPGAALVFLSDQAFAESDQGPTMTFPTTAYTKLRNTATMDSSVLKLATSNANANKGLAGTLAGASCF